MSDPSHRNGCDDPALLRVDGLRSGYGKKAVLHGISFAVKQGQLAAVIGPNGAGKSTLLKSIFGLLRTWAGEISFSGKVTVGLKPPTLISRGLVFVPQGNRVFSDLSVLDNLTVSLPGVEKAELGRRLQGVARIFDVVTDRASQLAGRLSGGERQQVALALALMKKPRMLLLDEPSLGLAPGLAADLFSLLTRICREQQVTILLAEHRVRHVLQLADHVIGLRRGEVVEQGPAQLFDQKRLKSILLG